MKFKAAPSMALSESGGTIRRRTAYSQNLREYESSNQTSGIRRSLCEMSISENVSQLLVYVCCFWGLMKKDPCERGLTYV